MSPGILSSVNLDLTVNRDVIESDVRLALLYMKPLKIKGNFLEPFSAFWEIFFHAILNNRQSREQRK